MRFGTTSVIGARGGWAGRGGRSGSGTMGQPELGFAVPESDPTTAVVSLSPDEAAAGRGTPGVPAAGAAGLPDDAASDVSSVVDPEVLDRAAVAAAAVAAPA
ncbi:hypothetical protein ACWCXL_42785, partial [Streptomyces sp. NPDC001588]